MNEFLKRLSDINSAVNDFVWVRVGLVLLIGTGVIMTVLTRFFQVRHFGHWMKQTVGTIFVRDGSRKKRGEKKAISQFQALCTALAATIGTGNIAGVSAAIVTGGPGAVFWMWVAAFFGMMTNFSENVLGIFFRKRNSEGEWSGGAMYYISSGFSRFGKGRLNKIMKTVGKILAGLFAVFAVLASFGIGNMGQVNKITINIKEAFFSSVSAPEIGGVSLISVIIGVILMILTAVIVIGGLDRIASVAEKLVPFMAVLYILGSLTVFAVHIDKVGDIFLSIFRFAFGIRAVAGGAVGITLSTVITQGCKRGVFSNEAGLGSSVMVHSSSDVKEPVTQGLWGIFEVFFDTMVVCTMTAIVVLSSGKIDLSTGLAVENVNDATLVADAYAAVFGPAGRMFVAVAILLFAFTTVLGWSQYGSKSIEYLFGVRAVKYYRIVFVLMIMSGAVMTSSIAWDISDTFNGLMMIPNLIGVLALSPLVYKITRNYVNRVIKGKKEKPMLSYHDDIQREHEEGIMK